MWFGADGGGRGGTGISSSASSCFGEILVLEATSDSGMLSSSVELAGAKPTLGKRQQGPLDQRGSGLEGDPSGGGSEGQGNSAAGGAETSHLGLGPLAGNEPKTHLVRVLDEHEQGLSQRCLGLAQR